MEDNIFDDARRLVSPISVATCYGFTPNRSGFICCPFHGERTPSLKLYDNRWYCFGCNQGGTVIDFVMKLFNLSPLNAIRKMNVDFNLALPLDQPPSEAQQKEAQHRRELLEVHRAFDCWRDGLIDKLNVAYRTGWLALRNMESLDQLTEAETLAVQWLETLEHWSDQLMSGNLDQQMEIFRERRAISRLCNRILNMSSMKSSAA